MQAMYMPPQFNAQDQAVASELIRDQHRPAAHAAMESVYASGNENERALAEWMDRLGMANHREI